jgi:hypothetical protein
MGAACGDPSRSLPELSIFHTDSRDFGSIRLLWGPGTGETTGGEPARDDIPHVWTFGT